MNELNNIIAWHEHKAKKTVNKKKKAMHSRYSEHLKSLPINTFKQFSIQRSIQIKIDGLIEEIDKLKKERESILADTTFGQSIDNSYIEALSDVKEVIEQYFEKDNANN